MNKDFFKNIKKNDVIRLVISFILAFTIWAVALSDTDPNITATLQKVQIKAMNLDQGYFVSSMDESCTVKVYGRSMQIAKINKSDVYAVCDLSFVNGEGTYTVPVTIKGLPDNIDVQEIKSEYITITVSKYSSRDFEISFSEAGKLDENYYVYLIDPEITKVTVLGNNEILDKISKVVATVKLDHEQGDFNQIVTLSCIDEAGEVVELAKCATDTVSCKVLLGLTKEVPVVCDIEEDSDENILENSIAIDPEKVHISGRINIVKDIDSVKTEKILLSQLLSNEAVLVGLEKIDGVSIDTNEVTVKGDYTRIEKKEFVFDSILVKQLGANLSISFDDWKDIVITIEAASEKIMSVSKEDIEVYIDLTGLEAGTHEVKILYKLPSDVSLSSINEEYVKVTIK